MFGGRALLHKFDEKCKPRRGRRTFKPIRKRWIHTVFQDFAVVELSTAVFLTQGETLRQVLEGIMKGKLPDPRVRAVATRDTIQILEYIIPTSSDYKID